jgi:hypothetical protein
VVLSLVAAGPGCGGNDRAAPKTAQPLHLREGALAPGLYEVHGYGPGVRFRIGAGWSSHHPGPQFFDVHRATPEGPAPGDPGWEVALLFLEPRTSNVQGLVREIESNGLEVTTQQGLGLGGIAGTRVDVAPSADDAPLFTFDGGEVGGFPQRRYRIWALPVEEKLLTIVLDLPAEGSESAPLADEVIGSIRFRSGT